MNTHINLKVLVNSLLCLVGLLLAAISAGIVIFGVMTLYKIFQQETEDIRAGAAIGVGVICTVLFSYASMAAGLFILQRSFDSSVPAWLVLRKGSVVKVTGITEDSVLVSFFPFMSMSRKEKVRLSSFGLRSDLQKTFVSELKTGYKYIYDGVWLQSVLEKKDK